MAFAPSSSRRARTVSTWKRAVIELGDMLDAAVRILRRYGLALVLAPPALLAVWIAL
jgi:hypothetical protein